MVGYRQCGCHIASAQLVLMIFYPISVHITDIDTYVRTIFLCIKATVVIFITQAKVNSWCRFWKCKRVVLYEGPINVQAWSNARKK